MVLGVRVHGPDVVDVEVKLDETFRSVPVPEKLGIPVLYKTQSGTGGAAIICDLKIEMHQMPIGTHGTHSIFHFVVLLKRISKHCNLLRRPAPLLGFAELKSDSLYIYIYYIVTSCQQGLMIPLVLAVNSTFLNAQIPHCFWDIYKHIYSSDFVGCGFQITHLFVLTSLTVNSLFGWSNQAFSSVNPNLQCSWTSNPPFSLFHFNFTPVLGGSKSFQVISNHSCPKVSKNPIPSSENDQSRRGDDSDIRSNVIVRFMADTSDGLAPAEWQYGGRQGPAPPVVLARKDQVGNAKMPR